MTTHIRRPNLTRTRIVASTAACCFGCVCAAQPIDFETFPGGVPTVDREGVSDQYQGVFGVRFDIVDAGLNPIGVPQIAKVGAPLTAFEGCGPDTPLAGEGVGSSFITDDSQISDSAGSLLLTYDAPVANVCAVILDVDRRPNGDYEEWTIDALDASGQVLETRIVTAPTGEDVCTNNYGPGDARALGFAFSRPTADIVFLSLRYTGTASSIGLAFDSFYPDSIPPGPSVTIAGPGGTPCQGAAVPLTATVTNGLPGLRYRWQRADGGGAFADIPGETEPTLGAPAVSGASYRVLVTDALGREALSGEIAIGPVRPVIIDVLAETGPGTGVFAPVASSVTPFAFSPSAETVFGWTSSEQYYHGAEPLLTINQSHLFLMSGAGGLSLASVHDAISGMNGGGRAEMRIDFTGAAPGFTARDDPADFYTGDGTGMLEVRNQWTRPNTDGWAAGPLDGAWTATVRFTETDPAGATIDGLDSWAFYSADGGVYPLPLEEDRAVRIIARCGCAPDLAEPFGVLNFFDIAEFIALYGAGDPAADIAPPFGSLNFFDVAAFIDFYNAGCP